jgi:uncharacterized OB-fold protein
MENETMPCPNCGSALFTEKFCPNCGSANPVNYIDESLRVEPATVMHKSNSGSAKRVIVMAAITVIGIVVAGFFANSYALDRLQFRVKDISDFDYVSLSSKVQMDICNPSAFPAGFDKFNAVIHYRGDDFATMSVNGGTVMPYQPARFDGKLILDAQTVSGLIVAFANAVAGQDTAYNEDDISMTMTVDAKILGIIPHTQTRDFTFSEFQQVMSLQHATGYSC